LIVDDSARARLLVEMALRAEGYRALTSVDSAQAAFHALGIGHGLSPDSPGFDLILMDLLMPDIDGIDACRQIKSHQQLTDVPIIMVTAEDSAKCLKEAFDAGAMDYVRKPVNRLELMARVQSALRLKQETDCRKAREQELLELTEKLRRLSRLDGLTEVANRRHFDEELARAWRRAQREGGIVSLVMVDIDHFKCYNDQYGHVAGDDCLRQVAEALRQTVKRPFDLVARYGGEEFVVLLPDTDRMGAEVVAEGMRAYVESLAILHCASKGGRVTISCGVAALAASPALEPSSLIVLADQCLYSAKHAGRNRVSTAEQVLSHV